LLIAAVAFALRFGVVAFSNGGIGGMYGYDAGVYYSAADALLQGRVPYRDFIFLHPPAIVLVLAPFAALGRLTTDHAGYVVANCFFELIAALNAVLTWAIARRWGFGARAALIGGLFSATWWGAINAEIGVRLEPLGSLAFLLAIFALSARTRRPRHELLAGAALALACCTKIWWVVPLLVLLVWQLRRRETRAAGLRLAVGAVGAATLLCGPFLALAGSTAWHRVVTDQLGRTYHSPPHVRIQYVAGLRRAFPGLATPVMALVVVAIGVVFVAAVVVAARHRVARPVVGVLVAQFLVLMVAPSFFNFYGGYLAGSLPLTVAAAVEPARRKWWWESRVGPAAALVSALVTLAALVHSRDLVDPFPGRTFERATANVRCVMVDSNSALLLMNRLTSSLEHGCPNWVDVTGYTYFGPAKSGDLRRSENPAWQHALRRYLFAGEALVIVREKGTQPDRTTRAMIAKLPVLARGDGYVLYRVPARLRTTAP
jgi:hypothetical protein